MWTCTVFLVSCFYYSQCVTLCCHCALLWHKITFAEHFPFQACNLLHFAFQSQQTHTERQTTYGCWSWLKTPICRAASSACSCRTWSSINASVTSSQHTLSTIPPQNYLHIMLYIWKSRQNGVTNPGRLVLEETRTHSHPTWSSDILYHLPPFTTIHGVLFVHFTCLTILLDNLSPGPLWSSSWSWTLNFILHTFLHPIHIIFSQHVPIPTQPVLLQNHVIYT